MKKTYNKLVRDRIPEIIAADGKTCDTRILSLDEYKKALDAKLVEELKEYEEASDVHELADIQEIIDAIVAAKGLTQEEFDEIKHAKAKTNGGFSKRIFLISVEDKK
jgi:predicted house-cleaning noncanonical NTP pyrophosphatase (MazG superfamily)